MFPLKIINLMILVLKSVLTYQERQYTWLTLEHTRAMIDPSILDINISYIPLGYTSMSSSSTTISIATHIASISDDTRAGTTFGGGTGPHASVGVGGGHGTHSFTTMDGTPAPPPLVNPLLNTIL